MMKPTFRFATMAYLILLGITLGAALYAGAVVAPVTFHTERWLGTEVLSHYQEGVIMTQNFIRLSYLVNLVVLVIFLYEGYKFKRFERDRVTLIAAIVAVSTGLLFAHYYLPDIVVMQQAGPEMTRHAVFEAVHQGSQIAFELFALSLLILMIQNMRQACK
jgi:Na+/H+ antiporter NhaC